MTANTQSAHLTGTAPILLARDASVAIAHYRDALGFALVVAAPDPPTFALLLRDAGAVMLARADDRTVIMQNWRVQSKTSNIYFWVDDATTLTARSLSLNKR